MSSTWKGWTPIINWGQFGGFTWETMGTSAKKIDLGLCSWLETNDEWVFQTHKSWTKYGKMMGPRKKINMENPYNMFHVFFPKIEQTWEKHNILSRNISDNDLFPLIESLIFCKQKLLRVYRSRLRILRHDNMDINRTPFPALRQTERHGRIPRYIYICYI